MTRSPDAPCRCRSRIPRPDNRDSRRATRPRWSACRRAGTGAPSSRLLMIARLPSMRPLKKASTAGSGAGFAQFLRKRYGPRKPLTFWLSKMSQRIASSSSLLALRQELARALGQIAEDHARLAELLAAMRQHRRFAHLVDVAAIGRRARLALEEIDEHRLPVRADQIEHQRGAIAVAGLGEAIELIFGHGGILHVRKPDNPA